MLALTPAPDALPIQHLTAAATRAAGAAAGRGGPGLSRAAIAASDVRVVIPMQAGVDSLNVAAAAAVAFWELGRSIATTSGK